MARATRAALLALLTAAAGAGAEEPLGTWNLKMWDTANRASGGEKTVLLRVSETDGNLTAQITSIRSDFREVHELRFENRTLFVRYGSYRYTLEVEGDRITGTMTSPAGEFEVSGSRQAGVLYAGDEPEKYYWERTGVIGHRTHGAPPENENDAAGWVRGLIQSPGDFALIVGRRHQSVIEFTNSREHLADLEKYAGQWVSLGGTWVGEKVEIRTIEPTSPPSRR